ncbi:MAG: hypothetical protein FWB90_00725 [Fibromonadales bacterium]|nr:hypothetical protein [Fibromonadales bacterium]
MTKNELDELTSKLSEVIESSLKNNNIQNVGILSNALINILNHNLPKEKDGNISRNEDLINFIEKLDEYDANFDYATGIRNFTLFLACKIEKLRRQLGDDYVESVKIIPTPELKENSIKHYKKDGEFMAIRSILRLAIYNFEKMLGITKCPSDRYNEEEMMANSCISKRRL